MTVQGRESLFICHSLGSPQPSSMPRRYLANGTIRHNTNRTRGGERIPGPIWIRGMLCGWHVKVGVPESDPDPDPRRRGRGIDEGLMY